MRTKREDEPRGERGEESGPKEEKTRTKTRDEREDK